MVKGEFVITDLDFDVKMHCVDREQGKITVTIELYGEMDFEDFFRNIEPLMKKEQELQKTLEYAKWKVSIEFLESFREENYVFLPVEEYERLKELEKRMCEKDGNAGGGP